MHSITLNDVKQSTLEKHLGTLARMCSVREGRAASLPTDPVAYRFLLQSASRELMPREKVYHCLRTPVMSSVEVLHSPSKQSAIYRGLQTCCSVWMCPVCSSRISEHRRRELRRAVANWRGSGGRVLLVTYTLRHKVFDDLSSTLASLLKSRRQMHSGRFSMGFRQFVGVKGTIYSLEVTYGSNGWHPHIHELIFVAGDTTVQAVRQIMYQRWLEVTEKQGLRKVNEHGIKVQDTDKAVADYIAKFGEEKKWTEAEELTKSVVKVGRAGSRGPMGLLESYALGDEDAGILFQEYAAHFKGRHQLQWSKGLRDLILPEVEEISDGQILGDVSDYPVLLATLSLKEWRVILANDARADVLRIAGKGCERLLWAFLGELGLQRPPVLFLDAEEPPMNGPPGGRDFGTSSSV